MFQPKELLLLQYEHLYDLFPYLIMQMEVVTPEESMGDVIGDLNKRRGQVEGMETRTGQSQPGGKNHRSK